MVILGIETSCDETAVCAIEANGPLADAKIKILSNITLSQAKLHEPYGGVFPNLAKREHIKNLPIILKEALKESGLSEEKPDINAIAVTYGPGLEPCLWTGITFAKELSEKLGVPLVPVNHMEGHIFSALIHALHETHFAKSSETLGSLQCDHSLQTFAKCVSLRAPKFPALALLISGGHTELDLMENYGKYRLIGETRDDAVGEAFDKVARLLGLPYPGGPEISRLAENMRTTANKPTPDVDGRQTSGVVLPRPMLHSPDYDFSFSGIKTAVLYFLKKIALLSAPDVDGLQTSGAVRMIAREFEDAVTEVLVSKTKRALREHGAQTLIVAGGVIANTHIRREFTKLAADDGITLLIPEIPHTTDNALMITLAAYGKIKRGVPVPPPSSIRADGTARIG